MRRLPTALFRGYAVVIELVAALARAEGVVDSAAELAYFALLSLFPFGSLALVAVSFLPVEGLDRRMLSLFSQVMPADVAALCASVLRDAMQGRSLPLLVVSSLAALWIASVTVGKAAAALNRIVGVTETRSYLHRRALGLLVSLASALLLAVALAVAVLGTRLGEALLIEAPHLGWLTASGAGRLILSLVRWSILAAVLALVLTLAYRLLPTPQTRRRIWPGVIFATGAWLLVSFAFGVYLTHFRTYAKLYGALGTAIALLTWLFLAGVVFLAGEAFNVSLARARRRLLDGVTVS